MGSTRAEWAQADSATSTMAAVRAAGDAAATAVLDRWAAYGGHEAAFALAGGDADLASAVQADATSAAAAAEATHLSIVESLEERLGATIQARQDRTIAELVELRRRQHALQAAEQRDLADLGDIASEWHELEGGQLHMHQRSVAAQIAIPLRASDRGIEARMAEATVLTQRWPSWLAALETGEISTGHLHALTTAGKALLSGKDVASEQVTAFERDALKAAKTLSVPRLRKRARVLADQVLTTPAVERHREARRDRRVWVQSGEDGMATLGVDLPATLANAIEHRLTVIARTKPKDDPRTIPNVMADTAAELLLTGSEAAGLPSFQHVQAVVHVTVPAATLASRSVEDGADGDVAPALLDGIELLDVETARLLAGSADAWWLLTLDPVTDAPCGIRRHDPTVQQREWLGIRDLWCRFPGCSAKAWRCDIDHGIPYAAGGCTELDNLEHLCRRHHMLGHHGHHGHPEHGGTGRHTWRVEHLGHGVIAWTDPGGRVYVDHPETIGIRARRPVFTDAAPPGARASGWAGDRDAGPSSAHSAATEPVPF